MKTYLRILSYASPFGVFIPLYFFIMLLAIVFGLVNFSLIIPLLDILFAKMATQNVLHSLSIPTFSLSIAYLKDVFNYCFINIIQHYGAVNALYFICVTIVTSVFLANLFRYFSEILMSKLRTHTICNLRIAIFDKISRLHIGYFTNERRGDIMARAVSDVQEVEYFVVDTLKIVFREPAHMIGYFAVLFYMSFELTWFTIIFLPIAGGLVAEIVKKLKKKATQGQESLSRLVSILDETLWGIRIVKAFAAQDYVLNKFKKENEHYAKINVSITKKQSLGSPLSEFMGVFVVGIILVYGGKLVLQHESSLTASEFIVYIIMFSQILAPAKSISQAFSSIHRGLASGRRIFSLMDEQPTIVNKQNATIIKNFQNKITFNDVSFSYGAGPVLQNLNFTLEKGKTMALVGPSGGGKSTISDLIPRFYDPTAGAIRIDGIDIRDYDLQALRRLMGMVTQESILFFDTVFNNIAFGKTEALEKEVVKAAKIANAHAFIEALPQGYQTLIGERGGKLSGGQKQSISIARAVLKNPPLLILDEATSALDTASEKLVQDALDKLMQHRTSLVIAHRLSTIQHADEILVIDAGKVVERGTHQALSQKNGLYTQLSKMQHIGERVGVNDALKKKN